VTTLESARALRPDDPTLLARLGRAYLAINQPIPATRVLTQSVAGAPQPAQTYADLGLARLGTGDALGATAALEHAVALDPAHAGAAQLLGEINAKLYGAGARR
jgi:predicted Zn-dependent protease